MMNSVDIKTVEETGKKYIKEAMPKYIETLLDWVTVEAPSGEEEERAELMCKAFRENGLSDVYIDKHGNAVGIRYGRRRDRYIVVEAHMDTVFPKGTVKERPKVENGVIRCPGIGDNTAGMVTVVTTLAALNHAGYESEYSILFAGTVGEEALGKSKGIRGLVADHGERIAHCITIDGFQYQDIVYKATGLKTEAYRFFGSSAHAAERDIAPQALLSAARMAEALEKIPLSEKTGDTLAVTNIHGGSKSNLHLIPGEAELIVNYRSRSPEAMASMEEQVHSLAMEEAQQSGIRYEIEVLCDSPCGEQSPERTIVKALDEVITSLGGKTRYAGGGSTNANVPTAAGISSVAIGSSNRDFGEHTLEEFMETEEVYKSVQSVYLLILRIDGKE